MRFGRKPRAHDPRVPLLSKLVKPRAVASLPAIFTQYADALPSSLGFYHNDQLGDCVEACCFHDLQVWSANANPPMDSEPEDNAILLYSQAAGYVPGNPSTDQGSDEQTVLGYWLNPGIPYGPSGAQRQQLTAFVEIDQRSLENIKTAILEGGLAFIGFLIPGFFNDSASVWDVDPTGDQTIEDGHAVPLIGWNDTMPTPSGGQGSFCLISWGRKYWMSYTYFLKYCDEAYLLLNQFWIEASRFTPFGQTLAAFEAAMQALKWTPGVHMMDRHRWHKKKRRQRAKRSPP